MYETDLAIGCATYSTVQAGSLLARAPHSKVGLRVSEQTIEDPTMLPSARAAHE